MPGHLFLLVANSANLISTGFIGATRKSTFLQRSLTPSRKAASNVLSEDALFLNIFSKCSTIVLLTSSLSKISSPLGDIKVSIAKVLSSFLHMKHSCFLNVGALKRMRSNTKPLKKTLLPGL